MAGNCHCECPETTQWLKGKLVGAGSFGRVHLAMDIATGGIFVVKSAETEAGIEALKKEAKILETLQSPHVVRYLGKNFSKTKNGELELNVLMEFMGGGSLSDIAEKFGGLIKEEVVRLYTREILKGLSYLHRDGLVHGDLKCKNVLVGSSGNVKLADFGFARRIKKFKENVGFDCFGRLPIGGTPLWMAPEVLRNESLDFSSDIWSLGCTVIEMATGSPPWGNKLSGSSPMAAVLKIACGDEKPQFPPFFSEHGRDFLAKCLDRDPERRWTAEKLLNHSFVSVGENGVSGSPASVLEVDAAFAAETAKTPNCRRNPFSRSCEEREEGEEREKEVESQFSFALSSENWITVR